MMSRNVELRVTMRDADIEVEVQADERGWLTRGSVAGVTYSVCDLSDARACGVERLSGATLSVSVPCVHCMRARTTRPMRALLRW